MTLASLKCHCRQSDTRAAGNIWSVDGGDFKSCTLIYKISGGEVVAQTLEKYQNIFTRDLHLPHSFLLHGRTRRTALHLRCLLWNSNPTYSEFIDKLIFETDFTMILDRKKNQCKKSPTSFFCITIKPVNLMNDLNTNQSKLNFFLCHVVHFLTPYWDFVKIWQHISLLHMQFKAVLVAGLNGVM